MSYDIYLYLREAIFPHEQWNDILRSFNAQRRGVSAEQADDFLVRARWVIDCPDHTVWLTLSQVRPPRHVAPEGAKWKVLISRSGKGSESAWVQFALVYYGLELVGGVAHDPQHEVCTESGDDFLGFANRVLPKLARSRALKRAGLMTEDGQIRF